MTNEEILSATKEQIVQELLKYSATQDSRKVDTLLTLLQARFVEDAANAVRSLEVSVNKNAASNDRLAGRVFALNVVIVIATIAGVVAAFLQAFK